jgi:hypothetical protein
MRADERIAPVEEQLKQALEQVQVLQEQLAAAQKRIEEFEKQKTLPDFVKANVKKPPEQEKKQRKKRAAEHNHGRPRSAPTQIVEHRIVTCPDCHLRLGGISLARVREIIDVPPPPPGEVTHHGHRSRFDRADRRDKSIFRLGRFWLSFILKPAGDSAWGIANLTHSLPFRKRNG